MANETISQLPVAITVSNTADYLELSHFTGAPGTGFTSQRVTPQQIVASVPGVVNAGGSNTQLQYNNNGAFGGTAALSYTTNTLTAGSALVLNWGSSGILAPDIGVSRISSGFLGIGNGTQGNTSGSLIVGPGTSLQPSLCIGGTHLGFSGLFAGSQLWVITDATSTTFRFLDNTAQAASDVTIGWNASNSAGAFAGANDTGLSRIAAATIAVGNGTNGDFSGSLKLNHMELTNSGAPYIALNSNLLYLVAAGGAPSGSSNYIKSSDGNPFIIGTNNTDRFQVLSGGGGVTFGAADAASPVAQTLSVQSVVAGTSNTSGVNTTIIGSLSTGSGTSGDIILQTGGTGAGATAQNAATTALTVKGATQQCVFAGTIRINVAPTAVSGAGPIAIGSGSTINSRMPINLNGTTYWIPCSTTAF
jgi:hypothetical protein